MKYLKMLGLAAVAAAALMAFVGAGTASANGVVCSTATNPCTSRWPVGTILDFTLESGSSAKLTNTAGETLNTCTGSTVKGEITSNPGGTTTTTGKNTEINWTGCLVTTDTVKLGKLKIQAEDDLGNAWLYADEQIEVTMELGIFGHCIYGVEAGTKLGTVKEGIGTSVTFTANAVAKRLATAACFAPETALWTGTYVLTSPSNTTFYTSTS